MRTRRSVLVASIALLCLVVAGRVWYSTRPPRLEVADTFDMGVVQLDQVGRYSVPIANTGTATLVIEKVTPG